ncbi:hypothetical protein LMG3458_00154 [Achromobacter deleyi]|uniref:Lipoprotein n=1 Tax=Achromobacter deleyi TaxID=1353891 RepID=A0A6S6YZM1_9BURK|nr:hypothetical protein [Achromobacter deleyi]CAB3652655.1 hypothetical protein LMG3458_00154 [Achromobacter deleyi]CAB3816196.1 hypothetical protein LMG3481_00007 [Achromobacter deleyi]CAB3822338.1 hypothetical protein LMG3412_00322 [Achromobacter deleyi]CAB3825829.1 hypothetical protein LMG3482_00510 [Achromobacter deleyi]
MPIGSCRALGACVMALSLLAACGKKVEYPAEVQRATYGSCVQAFKAKAPADLGNVDAKAKGYCQCVLDGLQDKVPLQDFQRYEQLLISAGPAAERERLEKAVVAVADVCLKRLPTF